MAPGSHLPNKGLGIHTFSNGDSSEICELKRDMITAVSEQPSSAQSTECAGVEKGEPEGGHQGCLQWSSPSMNGGNGME